MKARVKKTGEIVEINETHTEIFTDVHNNAFSIDEIDFDIVERTDPDYWEKLLHQYAGMAMQGLMTILPNIGGLKGRTPKDEIVDIATSTAHALVGKLKEKEEKK